MKYVFFAHDEYSNCKYYIIDVAFRDFTYVDNQNVLIHKKNDKNLPRHEAEQSVKLEEALR